MVVYMVNSLYSKKIRSLAHNLTDQTVGKGCGMLVKKSAEKRVG